METVVPADFADTTDEALAELENSLIAEFDALVDEGSTDVERMTEIAEAVERVRTESRTRVETAEKAAEEIAALADLIRPAAAEVEPEEADEDEAEAIVADETADEAPASEDITAEADEAEAETEERELVTASAEKNTPKAPSARAVSRRTVTPEAPASEPSVIIAAASDVPGFAGGQHIDLTGVAKAMHAKARTLSNGSGEVPVAQFQMQYPKSLQVGTDPSQALAAIEEATSVNVLTASGYCAPSVNLYDLFSVSAADGLLDLPSIQITRGGINVPGYIGINEGNSALWSWDEDDQDDSEATKPCYDVPCPTFTDYRLKAEGLCVTAGNLTDRAFPELTVKFVREAMTAHLHRMDAAKLTDLSTGMTAVTVAAQDTSAAGSILSAVDMQVIDYRSQFRLGVNAVLEAVFPLWTRELVRSDLAMRSGVALTNVSNADIDAHFATRGVRAQFVHNYLPSYSANARTAWQTQVKFMLYPAGGYLDGNGGTIDLGVVRDSTLNATNDYTAAWMESLYVIVKVGPTGRLVTVNFGVDGVTGCCPTAS